MTEPTFHGNADQQVLAAQVFKIMTGQGAMFASETAIRQTLTNLADFFVAQKKAERSTVTTQIDAAMRANGAVFAREEHGEEVTYITSKQGSYQPRSEQNNHMFKRRLFEPEHPLPIDDISVVVTTTRPALTTVEPVFISDYWQRQVGILPEEELEGEQPDAEAVQAAPVDQVEQEEAVAEVLELVTAPIAEQPVVEQPVVEQPVVEQPVVEQPVVEQPAIKPPVVKQPAVVEMPAPVAPVAALVVGTMLTLPNGVQIDLRRPASDLMSQYGATLVSQLRSKLDSDPLRRIVMFGSDAFPEMQVANFGKNDLRRIRDYIQQERQQPLLDTEIIADLFYHNPRQADYEAFRFALNYRLSKEKDFEFVGVEGARLWSAKGLPALGSKRVKASDLGQITGYIEEGFDDSLQDQSAEMIRKSGQLSHVLTFFEWEYGVLPLTRALAALLPTPLLAEQRTAVLRFDSPQRFTSALVELRYPTGNRGGSLTGMEEFFHENLVPGALLTIARTAEPQVFTIAYEEQQEATDRLLMLDEKKNKFAFVNLPYFVAVDEDMLVNQQRYGRLRNLKSLPMNERRKSEDVLEHVFDIIGEPVGTRTEPRNMAAANNLLVAMNVLRPTSRSFLEHLLKEGDRFEADGGRDGVWFYTPEVVEATQQNTDDEYDDDDDDY
ncbi:MAG: hypothetical protein H7Z42_17985 [Roseiflexaceae bacterium]|nr:hypothetical protein [Roseiflexaceae bacterium]